MSQLTSTRRGWKKSLLTIVWMITTGLFVGLLLHPAVPDAVHSMIARPNRLATKAVEYCAHVAVFFVGTQFGLVCLEGMSRARFFTIVAVAIALAVIAEGAQAWVPTRGVDVFDAVCNLAGVGLAAMAYRRLFRLTAVAAG